MFACVLVPMCMCVCVRVRVSVCTYVCVFRELVHVCSVHTHEGECKDTVAMMYFRISEDVMPT